MNKLITIIVILSGCMWADAQADWAYQLRSWSSVGEETASPTLLLPTRAACITRGDADLSALAATLVPFDIMPYSTTIPWRLAPNELGATVLFRMMHFNNQASARVWCIKRKGDRS